MRSFRHLTGSSHTPPSPGSSGRLGLRPVLVALALVASWTVTATVTATKAAVAEPTPLYQTMSGCGALAPLHTIQANPSNYRS